MSRRIALYFVLLLAVLSCAVGCSRKGRIIPEKKMAEIYRDMFLADQWLRSNPSARPEADTTLFFEPIFRRHGYSFKDYDRSVKHYLEHPENFSKIFTQASEALQAQYEKDTVELNRWNAFLDWYDALGTYDEIDFSSDSSRWSNESIMWPVYAVLPAQDTLSASLDSLGVAQADSLSAIPDSVEHEMVVRNLPRIVN